MKIVDNKKDDMDDKEKELKDKGEEGDKGEMADVNETDKNKAKEAKDDDKEGTTAKKEEENWFTMNNPSRVLKQQEKYIEWNMSARYLPVIKERKCGIVMVVDTMGDQP